jgi:hypothetical protein
MPVSDPMGETAEKETLVFRTTNAVTCEWCGAEPGESCHIQPGQFGGFPGDKSEKFHLCRIDPTSEPVGVLEPETISAIRRILPLSTPPSGEVEEVWAEPTTWEYSTQEAPSAPPSGEGS